MNDHRVVNKYFGIEVISAIALLSMTLAAIILANSPYKTYYENFIHFPLTLGFGEIKLSKSLLFWINDALISIFFFLIGLEIKRERFMGELSEKHQLILPCSAAIAGVIIPALIYTFFNYDNPTNMRGWAIPTAMDTAFSLGILSLLKNKIPFSLRIFIMSLAIIDDIFAVLVIALFYAEELSHLSILASLTIFGLLILINQAGITKGWPYVVLGFLLWLFVLKSGVHTSISGVLVAFTIPLKSDEGNKNLLLKMEKVIHPYVAYFILPLFAFANAGINLQEISATDLFQPLSLGIMLGLFIGKQLGIFGIAFILIKSKIAKLPTSSTWLQLYGAAVLCGIGFTMSLFIGALSFESGGPQYGNILKASILLGSFLSATLGCSVLMIKIKQK